MESAELPKLQNSEWVDTVDMIHLLNLTPLEIVKFGNLGSCHDPLEISRFPDLHVIRCRYNWPLMYFF